MLYLDATESRHCMKVLRKKTGDTIHVTDGKGFLYDARITVADIDQCGFEVVEKKESVHREYRIHIAISLLKNPDRLEWFVEKAIEFGVDEITLMV
ncbi:MAG TPA: RsmE family RNA methyltransferase, partial [Chryseolinea sp.]|nr:RsmE family RNA methyltransferase [Chryseolinea sp.]